MSLFMTLAMFESYKAIAPEIIFIMYSHSISDTVNQKENKSSNSNSIMNKKVPFFFCLAKFWELNFSPSNFIFS